MVNSEDELHKTVYAHAGVALYWCQCFEQSLTTILIMQLRIKNRNMILSEIDDYENKIDRKTLGALLKDARASIKFPIEADDTLNDALDKRNFLAHSFFKTHSHTWYHPRGPEKLIEELESIQQIMRTADSFATSIIEKLSEHFCITKELIDQWCEDAKKEASQNDCSHFNA